MTAYTQPSLLDLPTPQGAVSAAPQRVEVTGGAAHTAPVCPRPAVIRLGRDPHGRFTSAPEDATDEIAQAVHADHLPNRVSSREVIRQAVHVAAAEHDGLVHVAWIRPLLPAWAIGPQLGAALRMWTNAGHLRNTGEYLPNGDPNPKARNASKPAPVKRLARHIPPEAQSAASSPARPAA